MSQTTLVTGGAGYIGSHVIVALAAAGRRCICLDNYANSSPEAAERVRELVPDVIVEPADIRDAGALRRVLRANPDVDSVIHMAGLKAVGDSVAQPLRYYENNVGGTLTLLQVLAEFPRIRRFVFSSSATVYGDAASMPVDETVPAAPKSPYGRTKLMIEDILRDLAAGDPSWGIVNLRYFNPVGAHESGRIGEEPADVPNNVMPFICQVAAGLRERLQIFGDDYPTPDGTGVRDYIHVMDLAEGHVAALAALGRAPPAEMLTVNLGTGRGYSVKQLLETFERVNGVAVPRIVVGRRAGDIATCYADATRAERALGWKARRGLETMCRDAWRFAISRKGAK